MRFVNLVFLMGALGTAGAGATDFVTVKSGQWFDPTIWSPPPYPLTSDTATISNTTVTLTFSNALNLQLNGLNLDHGSLTINNLSGQGNLTMSGADSYWTNGTVNSGTVNLLGTLSLMGTNAVVLNGAHNTLVNNLGTLRQTDNGVLLLYGAIINSVGGIYEFAGDGNMDGSGAFTNEGTLLKSSGVNTSTITALLSNQGGLIEVDSGTLTIRQVNPIISSNGTFIVKAGATLDLTGGYGTAWWTGEITGSGAGQVPLHSSSFGARYEIPVNGVDA